MEAVIETQYLNIVPQKAKVIARPNAPSKLKYSDKFLNFSILLWIMVYNNFHRLRDDEWPRHPRSQIFYFSPRVMVDVAKRYSRALVYAAGNTPLPYRFELRPDLLGKARACRVNAISLDEFSFLTLIDLALDWYPGSEPNLSLRVAGHFGGEALFGQSLSIDSAGEKYLDIMNRVFPYNPIIPCSNPTPTHPHPPFKPSTSDSQPVASCDGAISNTTGTQVE